MLYMTEVR